MYISSGTVRSPQTKRRVLIQFPIAKDFLHNSSWLVEHTQVIICCREHFRSGWSFVKLSALCLLLAKLLGGSGSEVRQWQWMAANPLQLLHLVSTRKLFQSNYNKRDGSLRPALKPNISDCTRQNTPPLTISYDLYRPTAYKVSYVLFFANIIILIPGTYLNKNLNIIK